jgi:DHA1 family bicyclomycin/chloramphenicol resistance-like MFS transporter
MHSPGTSGSMTQPPRLGMSARRTAIVGGLMVTTGPLSLSLYSPALPALVADLGTTDAGGKLTLTVYFAAFACAQLVCGPVADRYGRRATGIAFFAVYVLGSLVCTLAPTLEVLLLGRLLQGFGVSAGIALSRAMVRDQFAGADAIRILTLVNLILTIAPAVSPTLGSLLMLASPWNVMFAVMAGFGLAIIAMLGFGAHETLPPTARVPLKLRTIIANYARLLRTPDFLLPALAIGCAFGGFYVFPALLPFILIDTLGLSPFAFAMVMLIQTGCFIAGNLIAARLARRLSGSQLMSIGLVLIGLAGLAFAVAPRFMPDSVLAVMVPVGLWMLALAAIGPSATTAAMSGFADIAGSAGAMTGFLQMGGGFVASLAASTMFAGALAGLTTIPPLLAAATILLVLADRLRVGGR